MRFTMFLLIILGWYFVSPAAGLAWTGRVIEVQNALVLTVVHENEEKKVRLFGIEVIQPGKSMAEQANKYTTEMLLGKEATFEVVDSGPEYFFAVVTQGETIINDELVRQGYAWVVPRYQNTPYGIKLTSIQANAKKKGAGVWADKNGKLPLRATGTAQENKQNILIKPRKPLFTF